MAAENNAEFAAALVVWADTIGERLLQVLSPIYVQDHSKPVLIGTGVLIRLADQVFLVSAAHVADETVGRPGYFGITELVSLPITCYASPIPENGTRDDDREDLAYWVLDANARSRLDASEALSIDDLDVFAPSDVPLQGNYFLNGYPCSRQRRRFIPTEELPVGTFALLTVEQPEVDYQRIGRPRESSLFVGYDKGNFYSDGVKHTGPDLPGVSGGALWRTSGPSCAMDRPLLSAIVTTWRVAAPFGVIGTRVRAWLRAIAGTHPEALAVAMETSRFRSSA